MSERLKRSFVFHPFLFSIYSILGPYAQNSSQVPIAWVWRPTIFMLIGTSFVYGVLQKKFQDQEYSGFVTTLFLNWIFMGHLYRFLLERSLFWRTTMGGLLALLLVSLPLVFLSTKRLWSKLSIQKTITIFLNLTSLVLVVYPLWVTAGILYHGNAQMKAVKEYQAQFKVALQQPSTPAPDIYLIIFDGYGREDFLQDAYDYDNSGTVEFLKEKGFFIAEGAMSNYPQTLLSVSSMMNMQYLNEAFQGFGDTDDRTALYELVQQPLIRSLLEEQGYTFMALPSATLVTQIRDADIFLNVTKSNLNEFETFLLSSTIAGVLAEAEGINLPVMGYDLHRRYTLFSLEKLREIPVTSGPKFVFAHIMLPHPPFIFDKNGDYILPDRPYMMGDGSFFPGTIDEYQHGYTEQMTFLNGKLTGIISDILARSENPPIIILMSDHGPGSYFNLEGSNTCLKERYSILNAYYFPDGDYNALYETITPVNSFRVILNQYFDANLELLDDRSYFSTWSAPYAFTDVTDEARSCNLVNEQNHD